MNLAEFSLGARIAELRTLAGYTVQELADEIGVSRVALWKWERESVVPRPERLDALSRALGVSTDYLIAGAHNSQNEAISQAELLHELIIEAKRAIAMAAGIRPERVTICLDY